MARRTVISGVRRTGKRRPAAAKPAAPSTADWSRRGSRRSRSRLAVPAGLRGLRLMTVGFGLLALAVVIMWIVRGPAGRDPAIGPDFLADHDPEAAGFGPGARAFSLYYVDRNGALVSELREIAAKPNRLEQIEAVLEELLTGSVRGHQPAVPAGTMLRTLFTDETGTVFVDLTRDVVRGQPGNVSAEFASLAALVRTVLANFPEFAAVQILIDGEPGVTLAGHFTIERPLEAADWMVQ